MLSIRLYRGFASPKEVFPRTERIRGIPLMSRSTIHLGQNSQEFNTGESFQLLYSYLLRTLSAALFLNKYYTPLCASTSPDEKGVSTAVVVT